MSDYDQTDPLLASARQPFAVTPDDAAPLPRVPKAIYVGTGGDLVLRGVSGDEDVTFANVPDGTMLPVHALFVRATGTTAGDIVALA